MNLIPPNYAKCEARTTVALGTSLTMIVIAGLILFGVPFLV